MTPFHLAFPVRDLDSARRFYGELLDCSEGRSAERWVDFNFFGHQISAHLSDEISAGPGDNDVDGDRVPVRHFGAILEWSAFEQLRQRLEQAGVHFRIPPRIRFAGQIGEQATMFLDDPSGNTLEFKSFRDPERVFAR
jgi:hypothetical protein